VELPDVLLEDVFEELLVFSRLIEMRKLFVPKPGRDLLWQNQSVQLFEQKKLSLRAI